MPTSQETSHPFPVPSHALGDQGRRRIICHKPHYRIYHESLCQDETHSRFYQFPNDAFVFVLKGQAFLEDNQRNVILQPHQGCWIDPSKIHKLVLLGPHLELLIIAYQGHLSPCADAQYLQALGELQTQKSKSQHIDGPTDTQAQADSDTHPQEEINRQTMTQLAHLSIELERFPQGAKEHLHYHRQSDQFIMVLQGELGVSSPQGEAVLEADDYQYIQAKSRHKLMNISQAACLCLSVYSPPPVKDRVLVLKK